MIAIDWGDMFAGVKLIDDPLHRSTSYLNRATGQVEHFMAHPEEFGDADDAIDDYRRQKAVVADSSRWIEIPKCDEPDEAHEAFILKWLTDNGIDARLY